MSSDYEIVNPLDLSEFDSDFESVDAPSFDEVPDGKYQARIESVRLEKSQKGDPMIKWDLVIVSGAQADRHVFKNSVISAASLPFVKGDLKTLGMVLAKFSELSTRLDELLDLHVEITKRTKGDYTNVYFNRRIQLAGGQSGELGDIPF
jgi:hypothetical protein